jgi:outer membrane protein OmpA-like peptidoglycan-associated protein
MAGCSKLIRSLHIQIPYQSLPDATPVIFSFSELQKKEETMKTKTILLCTVAVTLGAHSAHAENNASGPRYAPRPEISQKNYTQKNRIEDRMDDKSYEEYEQREQCQRYRKLPRNSVDNCAKMIEEEVVVTPSENRLSETTLLPVIHSYTVLFDFDKSTLRANENETINQVIREISRYNPKQITVTGYTDSSGDMDYNMNLSHRREQAVSAALLQRGIMNYTLDREARGENEQAVDTEDGVRNQENRRVVIDFRR